MSGDLSVVGGLDFGIAVSSAVAAVQFSYFGLDQKMATFDISDAGGSFLWRQSAKWTAKNKMLLNSSNVLSLYKGSGDVEGFIFNPNNGRITVSGAFGGIYSNSTPILKLDNNGLVSFGAQPMRVSNSVSSDSSWSGAFTVAGGIGVGKDSFINNVRLGRGNGNDVTNTTFGYSSLTANTTGVRNTGFGISALTANTVGSGNTAGGAYVLRANTTGSGNTAFGSTAMQENTIGASNSAFGEAALRENKTGSENVGLGSNALRFNKTGSKNVSVGQDSLKLNSEGSQNAALGVGALSNNRTGDGNLGLGSLALARNSSGEGNVGVGSGALGFNYTGDGNTAIGTDAGKFLVDGSTGMRDGDDNVFLGSRTRASSIWENNAIVIGASARSEGSNTTVIGNDETIRTHLRGETVADSLRVTGKSTISGQVMIEQVQGDISMGVYQ
ncbi:hypothetical protein ACFSSA_04355 [Luteolibacter algae]|uniref:Trimeric autotransporter adhesin YadA-like head domain-containing protein n=1 Tax=Luteolibacter algae TaxID=454151 RepID=A0ABW5D799_9BACT